MDKACSPAPCFFLYLDRAEGIADQTANRAVSRSRRILQALSKADFLPCFFMDTEVFPCFPWGVTQLTSYRFSLSFNRTPTTPVPELLTVTMCLLVLTFPSFRSV